MTRVTVTMRDEVATALDELARRNCMTRSGMATYLVMQASGMFTVKNAQQLPDMQLTPRGGENRA